MQSLHFYFYKYVFKVLYPPFCHLSSLSPVCKSCFLVGLMKITVCDEGSQVTHWSITTQVDSEKIWCKALLFCLVSPRPSFFQSWRSRREHNPTNYEVALYHVTVTFVSIATLALAGLSASGGLSLKALYDQCWWMFAHSNIQSCRERSVFVWPFWQ